MLVGYALIPLLLLASGCVTTRVEGVGAGGAGNYVVVERDAGTPDAAVTSIKGGTTPLTPELRNQLEASACLGWTSEAEGQPTLLTFVVDTSASMNDKAPNTGGRTKWEIARDSLQSIINHLPKSVRVGLLLYPNRTTSANQGAAVDTSSCVNTQALVSADALGPMSSAQRDALAAALKSAVVQGGTPTFDAYQYAVDNCKVPEMDAGSNAPAMVLITDGEPTFASGCVGTGTGAVDTAPLVDAISSAWNKNGIRTYVIGEPGSEKSLKTGADVRSWLSNAAMAGNTLFSANCSSTGIPNFCHLDLSQVSDFATGLQQVLQSITGQLISCQYALPSNAANGNAVNANSINVIYVKNGDQNQELLVAQTDSSCTAGDGWYFDSAGKIVLCASTCKTIQQDPNAVLRILGGCQSITLIN